MSDTPQGPGWWVASDGKYYPPQQSTPPPVPPPPAQPAPMYQAQPMYQPVQPMAPVQGKKKGNGCLWAALIVGVLVILLPVAGWFVIKNWVNENVGELGCSTISQGDAEDIFGNPVSMFSTGTAFTGVNLTLDDRIMPAEKGCNITVTGTATAPKPTMGAVFKVDKSDAAAFFKAELDKAKNGTSGQGPTTTSTIAPLELPNGETVTMPSISIPDKLSSSTDPYFLKDVSLGDEAFCTKANFFDASGVLVRKGNTVVYATVTAGTSAAFETDYSDSNCDYALKLATKALG